MVALAENLYRDVILISKSLPCIIGMTFLLPQFHVRYSLFFYAVRHKKNGLQNAARFVITVDCLAARDVYCVMVIFFT